MKTIIYTFLCFCFPLFSFAQEVNSPILFIYDASGSMWGQMEGKTKKEIAANTLSTTIQKLSDDQRVGLVAYGHRSKGDCTDIEFMVDMQNQDKTKIIDLVKAINPVGKTPLAQSALQAFDRLKRDGEPATIILITDGIESCDGDLCAVVKKAKEEGIDFRLHIIGFGLKEAETLALRCATEAGEGQYYDANDTKGLSESLEEATQAAVDELEKNFAIWAEKNGHGVDAYCQIFNQASQKSVKTVRTYRDTGFVSLPPGNYYIQVKPLEGSDVDAVELSGIIIKANEMTSRSVSFDAGTINIYALNNKEGWDAVVNIYAEASGKNVSNGRTYGRSKNFELVPGDYKVVLKALRMKGSGITHIVEKVKVVAKETTEVEHNFESGTLMIGAKNGDKLIDATVSIVDANSQKSVSAGRTYTSKSSNPKAFLLSPGTYKVKIKAFGEYKGKEKEVSVTIGAGEKKEVIGAFNK